MAPLLHRAAIIKWDSANLRQGTPYQCRHLGNPYEWMSVNHFPYLPIVTNPENNPCIQTVIRIAMHQNLIMLFIIPLPAFPENFIQIRPEVFCSKLVTNRQTDNDENIFSFVEVNIVHIAMTRRCGIGQ